MEIRNTRQTETLKNIVRINQEFLDEIEVLKSQQQQIILEYRDALEKRKIRQLEEQLGVTH